MLNRRHVNLCACFSLIVDGWAGTVWRDIWYGAMRVAHRKRERRKVEKNLSSTLFFEGETETEI
jgi:hypothetical protein